MKRTLLVERTGWTIDYIEGLDVDVLNQTIDVFDAVDKVREHKSKQ